MDVQPYQFAGEPFDPNLRFYYNRARWLDPQVGRFASGDPFLGLIEDPSSLHRYLYGQNNPVSNTDPTGLTSLTNVLVSLTIQATISAIATGALTFAVTRNVRKSLAAAAGGFVIGAVIGGAALGLRLFMAARTAAALGVTLGDTVIAADKIRFLLLLNAGRANGFRILGYTLQNVDEFKGLLAASRVLITNSTPRTVTQFGTKFLVEMEIVGASGVRGIVNVVWQVDEGMPFLVEN